MLIGIDASRANRSHRSGTEWYSYYLIKRLAILDKKNQYILYTDKPLKDGLLDLNINKGVGDREPEVKFDKDGFQIIKSPHNNFKGKVLNWPLDFFWTLGRLSLEMIFNKPDVLFVPAHGLPLFFPQKTITTIHDVAFERDSLLYRVDDIGPDRKVYKDLLSLLIKILTLGSYGANSMDYLKWSTRFSLKNAKKIITVSNFTKSEILKIYGKFEDKIKVIHNGYNEALYKNILNKEKMEEVLDKYGLEKPYVLYVGLLEKKKNTPLLINAFALVKEGRPDMKHKLALIGDASFGYDEVNYMVDEFGLESEVIMTGWVEESDLPCIFTGATAFVFPSKYEGFGIPVIQAMACGVPVVISDIPVLREVAGEAALYFDPNDKNDMARAITEIIGNSDLRERLVELGRKRVKEFSWEKCAEETLSEINEM